jgi:addiction module RelE/StbE family toxin
MPKVFFTESFKRKFKKFIKGKPDFANLIETKLLLLETTPYDPSLRNHKLGGSLNEYRAIYIDYDCRIIFLPYKPTDTYYLIDIGDHDDVY